MDARTPDTTRNRVGIAAAIAVAVAVLVAYAPALRAGWIWDDDSYVTANALVQRADGLAGIWGLARDPATGGLISNTPQYYPFVFTSFWIEHALFGLDPFVFHLTNVLLHMATAGLLWRLLLRLGLPGAGFAAALFALHPMHVESVAWVTERKNVMSGAFYLLAFLAYLRFDDERRSRWWALAVLAFVAALLSKSVTATLPILLGVAVFWRHERLGWRELAPILPFLALGVFSGWFTAWLEVFKVGAQGADFATGAAERALFVAPRAWWHYAATTWFPHPVMFVYPRWDPTLADPSRWIAPIGIVVLVAGLFASKRRTGWAPLLLVFASAITLAPALGFVRVYPHRYSWIADHFAYLGSIPLVALVVLAASALGRFLPSASRRAAALGVGALALAACAVLVHAEARHYHDARTLWEATIADNAAAALAQVSLGIELMQDPQRTPADETRAKQLFEAGARDPNMRDQACSNLGQWSLVRGDVATAIEDFRRAIEADPGHKRARAGLAEALLRRTQALGATSAGLRSAREASAEFPGDPRFLQFEAWILSVSDDAATRDPARARAIAEGLVARGPRDYGRLDTLAAACAAGGDFAAAIRHAEAALRLAPAAARGPFEERLALFRRGETYVEPPPR
jgi:tetratricopeptide (TPR) repeat protein